MGPFNGIDYLLIIFIDPIPQMPSQFAGYGKMAVKSSIQIASKSSKPVEFIGPV
jgi:hypothetical protein